MDKIQHFAERAVSYLAAAGRVRDRNRREQYLALAACCLEAAARRAHGLIGNGTAVAEHVFRTGPPSQAESMQSTEQC
jgi:hypothetical protein